MADAQDVREQTKTVVDAYYSAGRRGELASFAPYIHPEFTVNAPNYLPWGGEHNAAFFVDVLSTLPDVLDFSRFRFLSFTAEGTHAVAFIDVGVTGTDRSVQISEHWEVVDGKARSIKVAYYEPQALLAKLGIADAPLPSH